MERLAKNPYWVGRQEGHNRFYNKIRWWVDLKDIIDFTIIASMTLEIILVSNICLLFEGRELSPVFINWTNMSNFPVRKYTAFAEREIKQNR